MDLETILATIPGWLDADEAQLLHDTAAKVREGCIVEIGAYRGRSTLVMATAAHVPLYSIDPYLPSDNEHFGDADRAAWMENVIKANVANRVRAVHLKSIQTAYDWQEPIGLLFIDGDHNLAYEDFMYWNIHVVKDGYIAFHDSDWPDIKFTLEAIRARTNIEIVTRVDATTLLRVCS